VFCIVSLLKVSPTNAGSYFQDFGNSNVGDQSFSDGSQLFSTSSGTVTAVVDATFKELRLTAAGTLSTQSAFLLPNLDPGTPIHAFSAKWNAQINGNFPNGADGFSFNFGQLGSINLKDAVYFQEAGYGTGLCFSVQTYLGNNPGFFLRANGTTYASQAYNPVSQWGANSSARHFFEVDWHYINGMTVRVDGQTIFSNVTMQGFAPQSGDRFVWAARTGGVTETVQLDNIVVVTGGTLFDLPVSGPYIFNPGDYSPDFAFDGINASPWYTQAPAGFIGGTPSIPGTICAYAITSVGNDRAVDPKAWTFESFYPSGGSVSSGGGSFANPLETRCWLATSGSSSAAMRLNILINNGSLNMTMLGELRVYGFRAANAYFGAARPGDAISATSPNSPFGQTAMRAIDGTVSTKYLNGDKLNAGFNVYPSAAKQGVRALSLISANDAQERDPINFVLYGSNDGTNFAFIASNSVPAFASFNSIQSFYFPNTNTYPVYKVLFPNVRNPALANSMQIAEVQLLPYGDITSPTDAIVLTLPPGAGLTGTGLAGALLNRKLSLQEDKIVVTNLPATSKITALITPRAGRSIVKGIQVIGGYDDASFPGRGPSTLTMEGSNDGLHFTPILSTPLSGPIVNLQIQEFSMPENANAFSYYRVGFLSPPSGNLLQLGEVRLFGLTFPSVSVNRSGNDVMVSWPAPAGSFLLQERSNLTVGNWANSVRAVTATNGQNQVLIPPTTGGFYRLVIP
jgi:hypothetical protein